MEKQQIERWYTLRLGAITTTNQLSNLLALIAVMVSSFLYYLSPLFVQVLFNIEAPGGKLERR